jgi:hypothetical protein
MEENRIVVLDQGVTAEEVAIAAACCKPGMSANLRTEPDA